MPLLIYTDHQVLPGFGEGSGPIFFDQLNCAGTELSLLDCENFALALGIPGSGCDHSRDVGVMCEGI